MQSDTAVIMSSFRADSCCPVGDFPPSRAGCPGPTVISPGSAARPAHDSALADKLSPGEAGPAPLSEITASPARVVAAVTLVALKAVAAAAAERNGDCKFSGGCSGCDYHPRLR